MSPQIQWTHALYLRIMFWDSYLLYGSSISFFLSLLLPTFSVLQVVVGLPFLLILFMSVCGAIWDLLSCVQEKDKLAPKPDFFGHRGAPMVGLSMTDVGGHRCAWVRMRQWHIRSRSPWRSKELAWDDRKRSYGKLDLNPGHLILSLFSRLCLQWHCLRWAKSPSQVQ